MHALYSQYRNQILFGLMAGLLILVAVIQSPSVALTILNLCLISAIMSLGVNIQWGYAGLFNVGVTPRGPLTLSNELLLDLPRRCGRLAPLDAYPEEFLEFSERRLSAIFQDRQKEQ